MFTTFWWCNVVTNLGTTWSLHKAVLLTLGKSVEINYNTLPRAQSPRLIFNLVVT